MANRERMMSKRLRAREACTSQEKGESLGPPDSRMHHCRGALGACLEVTPFPGALHTSTLENSLRDGISHAQGVAVTRGLSAPLPLRASTEYSHPNWPLATKNKFSSETTLPSPQRSSDKPRAKAARRYRLYTQRLDRPPLLRCSYQMCF
ncbi:hypothetical protein BC834DRAFT_35848 [Gloeopeniophorella convolvens]|nr:hypothetical protein BC834DRAFT_35848 [Gloeopeniophorella convolvens]